MAQDSMCYCKGIQEDICRALLNEQKAKAQDANNGHHSQLQYIALQ